MFSIFSKKGRYPDFPDLTKSEIKDKYFLRDAEWDLLNNDHIYVVDPFASSILTLDPWPEIIFLAAKGQMTIQEYIFYVANQYSGEIPENLDKTILDQIQTLLSYRVVRLSDMQEKLEPKFEHPKSNLRGG